MSTQTTNYDFNKPELTDIISTQITDCGNYLDIIDAQLYLSETHIASSAAHAAQSITYTGGVIGQTQVKGAVDNLQTQLTAAVVGSGTSPAEVTTAREGIRGETNTVLNDRLDRIECNLGLVTSITGDTTLTVDQRGIILCDTTSNNIVITLPTAVSTSIMVFQIKKTSSDSNYVTIDANGSQTIDGQLTFTLSYQNDTVKIVNDGSNWLICSYIDTVPSFTNIQFSGPNPTITNSTADGSDNKYIILSGGGSTGNTRGGYIKVSGNEETGTGKVLIEAGNVSGGTIDFYTQGANRGGFDYSGNLLINNLTASRVVVTDANKNLASSSVSSTILGYLDIGSSLTSLLSGKEPTVSKGNLTESTSSVLTISSGTGAVIGSGTSIQVKQAGASQAGYLSSTDWSTFNGKQSSLSFGNLSETTSSILTITGGTGAIIGSGLTIEVKAASAGQNGYLSSTDWSTFNGKQSSLSFSNLSGTTNQINLSASGTGVLVGSTSITLSLPQSIATSSTPQFAGITIINTASTPINVLTVSNSGLSFFGVAASGQLPKVNDPSGGGTTDAEARTAINSILDTLEAFGLHAAS